MTRPRINTQPPADASSDHSKERVIEFTDAETGAGGLISFRHGDNGKLYVNLYRLDSDVMVNVERNAVILKLMPGGGEE